MALYLNLTISFFCFPVYPAFAMRNPGPTINGQRNPEGYITGYPVSASRETNNKILIEIDKLPVTAAVTLELEELSIDLSTHPSLENWSKIRGKILCNKTYIQS